MMMIGMMTIPGNQSAKESRQEHCIGRWPSRQGSFGASSFMIIKSFYCETAIMGMLNMIILTVIVEINKRRYRLLHIYGSHEVFEICEVFDLHHNDIAIANNYNEKFSKIKDCNLYFSFFYSIDSSIIQSS